MRLLRTLSIWCCGLAAITSIPAFFVSWEWRDLMNGIAFGGAAFLAWTEKQ